MGMGWINLEREKGVPHALRVASEQMTQLFHLDGLEIVEWFHTMMGRTEPISLTESSATFGYHIDGDPTKPLHVTVFLQEEHIRRLPNSPGEKIHKVTKIEGHVPGLWQNSQDSSGQIQIRPETHLFTIDFNGKDILATRHSPLPF